MKYTNIQWTDGTINGSSGCDGCELWGPKARTCYAGRLQESRLAEAMPDLYAKDFKEVRLIPGRFKKAASWGPPTAKEREKKPWLEGLPRHIFVGDMGDFLSAAVPDSYLIEELFGAILSKQGQRHIWQLLTKRPRRLADLARRLGGLPKNVVAMTTVTDNFTAKTRIKALMDVDCHMRGLSVEPLLEPTCLNLVEHFTHGRISTGIGWVITGGESGPGFRPSHIDWFRAIRDECRATGTPYFHKQFSGEVKDGERLLDGVEWSQMPAMPA